MSDKEQREQDAREYMAHKEPIRRHHCFRCGVVITVEPHTVIFDGKYHFCNSCDNEDTEVMEEIDTARRRVISDLNYLKQMVHDAMLFDDYDYAKGVLTRSLDWVNLDEKQRLEKIKGGRG